MKKILILNSSYRLKNTYSVLKKIEPLLIAKGYEVEWVHLKSFHIQGCTGCECCITKDFCPLQDEAHLLMKKITSSDGIILSTPVYLNNMSGPLKLFIDRTCKWFHRTELAGKPVLLVATTQGSGLKHTIKSLSEVVTQWGMDITGTIMRTGRNLDVPVTEKELLAFCKHLDTQGNSHKASLSQVMMFSVQKALANKIFEKDRAYWESKGWLSQNYFDEHKASWVNKQLGHLLYHTMQKHLKPHNH